MNYHSDEWIMERLNEHLEEAYQYFPKNRIVGIFIQGSQNYGLDIESSDIDTKLIVTPSFEDIVLNKKAVSTTYIRANDEHTDWKDVRLYMETFRKQNLNFLEILFTPYKIINPMYEDSWNKLIEAREDIARMNPYRAVKSMKGIALEKYHAMEHRYPSKIEVIDKYGYDPKQLHHLVRVEEYLGRYIAGDAYSRCLQPNNAEYLMDIKKGKFDLDVARIFADTAKANVERIADTFCADKEDSENPEMRALLEQVQYEIIKTSILEEIAKNEREKNADMAYLWRLP